MLLRVGVAAALVASAAATVTLEKPESNLDEQYEMYLSQYNKQYSPMEYARRKEIFERNMKIIEQLNANANDDQAEFAPNHLTDVDPSEFLMSVTTGENHEPQLPQEKYIDPLPTDNLPESWDWRDHGAVTPVQNQGLIGSCWAFSAAQAVEGAYFMKHNKLVQLSVEQIVECDPHDCGAFGGWPHQAYQYIQKAGGLVSADDLPYCAGGGYGTVGACTPCMAPAYNKTFCGDHHDLFCDHKRNVCNDAIDGKAVAKVIDWHAVMDDEDQVRAALVKYGPLSVALNANWLQFYFKGILNIPFHLCGDTLNHAVLLVGYGEDKTPTFFHPGGRKYFILKNSWGPGWGEEGYLRLMRGKGICGIRTDVTFPVVE